MFGKEDLELKQDLLLKDKKYLEKVIKVLNQRRERALDNSIEKMIEAGETKGVAV